MSTVRSPWRGKSIHSPRQPVAPDVGQRGSAAREPSYCFGHSAIEIVGATPNTCPAEIPCRDCRNTIGRLQAGHTGAALSVVGAPVDDGASGSRMLRTNPLSRFSSVRTIKPCTVPTTTATNKTGTATCQRLRMNGAKGSGIGRMMVGAAALGAATHRSVACDTLNSTALLVAGVARWFSR